jgi:hypothetical protein
MRLKVRSVAIIVLLLVAKPVLVAGGGNYAPNYEAISNALVDLLSSLDRMALPVERIRQASKAHYIDNDSSIYWVGTGHTTPFLQRLEDAQFDGRNLDDYPVDTRIDVRDAIEPNDLVGAAREELHYSVFLCGLHWRRQNWPSCAPESKSQPVSQSQYHRRLAPAHGLEEAARSQKIPLGL